LRAAAGRCRLKNAKRWWPSAKTILRVMKITKKFGLEFLPPQIS
jgi:hypothetical protein